jgi:hypothetical protein
MYVVRQMLRNYVCDKVYDVIWLSYLSVRSLLFCQFQI